MKSIKKTLLPACVILICFQSIIWANEKPDQTKTQNIEAVIDAFKLSIINKDKALFVELFYNEAVPWLRVASDKTIALVPPVKEGKDQRAKVRGGSYLKFIDMIVAEPKAVEEKFWDIEILQDGDIASVHFKYSFHRGEVKTNWGEEAWQLVRTKQGWKIASVIYSVTIKA